MTRRSLIFSLTSQSGLLLIRAWAKGSGQFWNDKPPAEWSADEIDQLISKSPWAKEATLAYSAGAMGQGGYDPQGPAGGGGRGGMGGGGLGIPGGIGLPGGGMGGRRGGMGGPGGMGYPGGRRGPGGGRSQAKVLVRWETAQPVRAALKKDLPEGASGHYILSLNGLRFRGDEDTRAGDAGSDQDRPRDRMLERLRQNSQLLPKDRAAIFPGRVERADLGNAILLFFPRGDKPLTAQDKEVTFQSAAGSSTLKVRFSLRDMLYHGELAL
ncbi:MAG: hypothetical protein IT165_31135 [Bryobacterales bacterium]|nr:hypothetical protein [Bryobacterales bacterium]